MSSFIDQQQTTKNRRLGFQLASIALLTLLPLFMIVRNGMDAMTIVSPPPNDVQQAANSRIASLTRSVPTPATRTSQLRFGIHDPGKVFVKDGCFKIRHVYISWVNFDSEHLTDTLRELETQGYEPLLTIEPWQRDGSNAPLLPSIANGDYDDVIDRVAQSLRVLEKPAILAWGHEMDQDLTVRYPWSGRPPQEYVRAYQYVVDRIRKQMRTKHKWVWTGVMKEGTNQYWPGDSYADFIGMPIYSFPAWDQTAYGYIRDFKATFGDKRRFVADLGKPIIITELGVNGSDDFERFWLHQAFIGLDSQPDIAAVVFFYAKDSEGVWGEKWDTPDWRVNPDLLRGLAEWKVGQAEQVQNR